MKELERTFLAKFIPENLENCEHIEIIDIYIPKAVEHPTLRIRKLGNVFEMTKKEPVTEGDSSIQEEQTIKLREDEFTVLSGLDGKRFRKIRYYFDHDGRRAEIDVFQDDLKGLVLVDFEFDTEEEKNTFQIPDFCLVDVTQENFVAGGMLCGKLYDDIESQLRLFNYNKISIFKQNK